MRSPAFHLLTALILLANLLAAPWLAARGPSHRHTDATPALAVDADSTMQSSAAESHCAGHGAAAPADVADQQHDCCDNPDAGCSCGCTLTSTLRVADWSLPVWQPVALRVRRVDRAEVAQPGNPPFRPPAAAGVPV